MIKAIIFDLGGVIVSLEVEHIDEKMADFLGVTIDELRGVTSRYKADLTEGKLSLSDVYSHVLEEYPRKGLSSMDVLNKHLEVFRHVLREFDQTVLLLVKKLRDKGYRVVCLANAEKDVIPIVGATGLYSLFEKAYISTELGMKKPDQDIYIKVLDDLGCSPAEVIFIDDKLENVRGAEKLGIKSIHYIPGIDLKTELAKYSVRVE